MENIKLIIEIVIALIGLLGCGVYISYKVRKNRKTNSNQKNITIKGNNNKVIGGDDNSIDI